MVKNEMLFIKYMFFNLKKINMNKHRDNDLPAEININCSVWYQNKKKHRDNDLPAIVCSNGIKRWFEHGKERKFR